MSILRLPSQSSLPEWALVGAEPPGAFTWTRRAESGGSISLILAGELDLAARAYFATALHDAQGDSNRVVLDLRALTLIDCSALFVLFTAAERSRRDGAVLILRNPRRQVRRVLDLVGVPAGVVVLDHEDLPSEGSWVAP
jgi:anti-anti-sigma factor